MTADQSELRLSDDERREALDVLSEHVSTGRLDLVEFDERSAAVSTAKRRKDLEDLFRDLPDPKPSVLRPMRGLPSPVTPAPRYRPRGRLVRNPAVLPIAVAVGVLVVVAILTRGMGVVMLLPMMLVFTCVYASRR